MSEALAHANIYTEEDYYNLPENVRAELIDGQIYYMSAPSRIHQEILSFLHLEIGNYLRSQNGSCKVYTAPFAVKLFSEDDRNVVEPDVSVICDPNKLTDRGCTGAPDWIVEIVSPSNSSHDYVRKLNLYMDAGVREYWIVNPMKKAIQTYIFEGEEDSNLFSFDDEIPVHVLGGLTIKITDLL